MEETQWAAFLGTVHVPSGTLISAAAAYEWLNAQFHLEEAGLPAARWPAVWRAFLAAGTHGWAVGQLSISGSLAHYILGGVLSAHHELPKAAHARLYPGLRWKHPVEASLMAACLPLFETRTPSVELISPDMVSKPRELHAHLKSRKPKHVLVPLLEREADGQIQHWALLWVDREQNAVLVLDPMRTILEDGATTSVSSRLLPHKLWRALVPSGSTPKPIEWAGSTPRLCDPAESGVFVLYYIDQITAALTKTAPLCAELPARFMGAYRWHLASALSKHA